MNFKCPLIYSSAQQMIIAKKIADYFGIVIIRTLSA